MTTGNNGDDRTVSVNVQLLWDVIEQLVQGAESLAASADLDDQLAASKMWRTVDRIERAIYDAPD